MLGMTVIRSMTAFAREEQTTAQGELIWEVRSVNHRYLDVSLRLDERFRALEMPMRKLLSDKLARGKVDATLRYNPNETDNHHFNVNEALSQTLLKQCDWLASQTTQAMPIDPLKVLQWPGVIKTQEIDQDALNDAVMTSLTAAVEILIQSRETEGHALKGMIIQRCDDIALIAQSVRQRMPNIVAEYQQRMTDRISELQVTIDPERLEQELVLLAQKSDVAEELDRLESHIVEVRDVLERDEPVGRRLDFLMQELNREANTLGSKSINTETTNHSVTLKVLIEQMREQIQNIE